MLAPEGMSDQDWDLACRAGRVLIRAEQAAPPLSQRGNPFDTRVFINAIEEEIRKKRPQNEETAALWKALLKAIQIHDPSGIMDGDISRTLQVLLCEKEFNPICSTAKEIQEIRDETFDIKVVKGNMLNVQNTVRMDDVSWMEDPTSYYCGMGGSDRQDSRYFNYDDFRQIKVFLNETFGEVDTALIGIVLRTLAKDLVDQKTLFVLIRKYGLLAGIGRVKKSSIYAPTSCEIGTMYTDRDMRSYGFGAFIERLALSMVRLERQHWTKEVVTPIVYGSVSVYLPAIARHFYHSGVIGTGIGHLDDGIGRSGPMIWLTKADWVHQPKSLQEQAPSNHELTNILGGREHLEVDGVSYYQADTDPQSNADFIRILNSGFGREDLLTRFFNPDPESRQAIFAFESRV